jgi:hypothetical protein
MVNEGENRVSVLVEMLVDLHRRTAQGNALVGHVPTAIPAAHLLGFNAHTPPKNWIERDERQDFVGKVSGNKIRVRANQCKYLILKCGEWREWRGSNLT